MKIKYRSNLWAGIIGIILGVAFLLIIPKQIGADYVNTHGISSRTIPYAVSILFIICGVALMFQSLILKRDTVKVFEMGKEFKAIAYMAVLLVYAILFKYSFLISTSILGVITLAFMGVRKWLYYLVIIILAVVLYLVFTQLLHVRLP